MRPLLAGTRVRITKGHLTRTGTIVAATGETVVRYDDTREVWMIPKGAEVEVIPDRRRADRRMVQR